MTLLILALMLVAGSIGLIFAAHCQVIGLSLDSQIRPLEVATLAVNIFIAFFLQYYLASRATDTRAEKNLLIDNIKELIHELRICRDLVSSCHSLNPIGTQKSKEILSLLRQVANDLENLELALGMSDCSDLAPRSKSLQQDYFACKIACTGGKFPKSYDRFQISEQDRAFRTLQKQLQTFVFDINRHR